MTPPPKAMIPSISFRLRSSPKGGRQVLGTNLKRSESGGEPACRTQLSPSPPTLGQRRHRGLARRLVVSARAYVGFVRANVAEYDITEVCHRSRGRSVIRCAILT